MIVCLILLLTGNVGAIEKKTDSIEIPMESMGYSTGTIVNFPKLTYHVIDPEKIKTLDDVIAIMRAFDFTVTEQGHQERFDPIRHLFKGEGK